MFETGITTMARGQSDPPLHLLVHVHSDRWRTYCNNGNALRQDTPSQRRCPRCLTAVRRSLDGGVTDAAQRTMLEWYLKP